MLTDSTLPSGSATTIQMHTRFWQRPKSVGWILDKKTGIIFTKFIMDLLSGTNQYIFKILSKRVVHSPIYLYCSESSTMRPIRRINFSQPQRDSHLAVAIDKVEAWYRALKTFYSLALHPSNLYQFKLEPSDTLFHSICLMRKNNFISLPSQDSYLHLIIYAACMGALASVLI